MASQARLPRLAGKLVKPSILVVAENHRLLKLLRSELEKTGYTVLTASDGSRALSELEAQAPDLVILSTTLPDTDGLEVCRKIRGLSSTPIVCLVPDGTPQHKVRCFELGADDCLTLPLSIDELLARVRAVLRRTTYWGRLELQSPLVQGGLSIDFAQRQVLLRGQPVRLTPLEYSLLCELANNAGHILPHEYLLTKVWGAAYRNQVEYLWVNIRRLRQKIEPNPSLPQYIHAVPGAGYVFRLTQ